MPKRSYRSVLYFITSVIMITLAIQVYWNYKNYEAGKQQLINEVQISLDNAVDEYFNQLAKEKTIFIMPDSMITKAARQENAIKKKMIALNGFRNIDSFNLNKDTKISVLKDTNSQNIHILKSPNLSKAEISRRQMALLLNLKNDEENNRNINKDSIRVIFRNLASKAIISIAQDSLKLEKINSLLKNELSRKNINVDYGLRYTNPFEEQKQINSKIIKTSILKTTSKSSFLPRVSELELFFTNERLTIFKKNLVGISLSFLLMSSVIACLLFLLRTINRQKQLAELKNDLISNITHEFKTPIATINAALEGIQNFNKENDPDKTEKYVQMSSNQLSKLNIMVEKILETSTLDSDELQLKVEEVYLADHIQTITIKHQINSPEKKITFNSSNKNIRRKVDVFHFENAINNIIDNAIKYGGDTIEVNIKKVNSNIIIEIIDDGKSLTKAHKEKIFEKFYRVPMGNTHDVKGFGIGLFYTKTIIEKHGGTIQLFLDQGQTNFKIILPNG